MNVPGDLKYTSSDEWVRLDGNLATIGISDYAQDQLSDIVYLEVRVSEGDTIAKGDVIAIVESVTAASDIYSPLSGSVESVNEALADAPDQINTDPYGAAWIVCIRLSNPDELGKLFDPAGYSADVQRREA
jgi:glycine cleavage system H protein